MKTAIFILLLVGCNEAPPLPPPPDGHLSAPADLTAPAEVTCLFDMHCDKCNALGVCP